MFCLQLQTRVLVPVLVHTHSHALHVFAASWLKRCICSVRNAKLLCIGQHAFLPPQGETDFIREGGNEDPDSKLASVPFFHMAGPKQASGTAPSETYARCSQRDGDVAC